MSVFDYKFDVSVYVPGVPIGKGRARARVLNGKPSHYTPAATKRWEVQAAFLAKQEMKGRPPFEGPIALDIIAWVPVPESWSKKKKSAALSGQLKPTIKPDADNIAKIVGDAFNGVVWADDSQICVLYLRKLYSGIPQVVAHVTRMAA